MNKILAAIFVCSLVFASAFAQAELNKPAWELSGGSLNEAKRIKAILQRPDKEIDLAKVKLTIDKMIDPTVDIEANLKKIGLIVARIRAMLGPIPPAKPECWRSKSICMNQGLGTITNLTAMISTIPWAPK